MGWNVVVSRVWWIGREDMGGRIGDGEIGLRCGNGRVAAAF